MLRRFPSPRPTSLLQPVGRAMRAPSEGCCHRLRGGVALLRAQAQAKTAMHDPNEKPITAARTSLHHTSFDPFEQLLTQTEQTFGFVPVA
jgi:hypothetical protein